MLVGRVAQEEIEGGEEEDCRTVGGALAAGRSLGREKGRRLGIRPDVR